MQYEPDFRFDVDDSFSMCSQSMTCPSTTTSFSSASSAYDPFTPNSRRSSPNDLSLDFDPACSSFGPSHPVDMTPPSASMKYMFGAIKPEPEQLSFNENILPSTPMKSADGLPRDYEHMLEMNMTPQHSMGSLTPSNSFGMYTISPEAALGPTSFMMTPTQSLSGSEMADHQTWACNNNESPINFFAQAGLPQHDMQPLKLERHSQSPLGRFQLHGPPSPNRMRADRKMMVHEIQRKTTELQRAQIRASKKRAGKSDTATVDVVRRAMCKCDYPDCNKAFRRNEHLKRHKQTFHGEGPNRFTCQFCKKDGFNRQDNLNNHRKLHARRNGRNRAVEFFPEAVAIIEEEERSRKRRAPSKAKLAAAAAAAAAEGCGDDY